MLEDCSVISWTALVDTALFASDYVSKRQARADELLLTRLLITTLLKPIMSSSTTEEIQEDQSVRVAPDERDHTDAESAPTSSSRGFAGTKDRWGFLNSDEFHRYLEIPPDIIDLRKQKESKRSKKWIKMMKNWQKYCRNGRKYEKMSRRSRKGIPDMMRGWAWYQQCGAEAIKQKIPDPWKIDVSGVSPITVDEVSLRTVPVGIDRILCDL